MKKSYLILLILGVLVVDQVLKIYIKATYQLNDSTPVIGSWFQLYFVENPGMAYGWKFGGDWGKMILTIFRLAAVVFGTWYLAKILREKRHKGFIICAGLVYAGAVGNLIDSCFYGLIFDKGMIYDPALNDYIGYRGLARFSSDGYAAFLHGNVVDMLYFPLIQGTFPAWIPVWGGEDFEFFRPIFNIADAAITGGIITILVFQNRFFRHNKNEDHDTIETGARVDDASQVS